MVVFSRRLKGTKPAAPVDAPAALAPSTPIRWSDIAANRKSTHPNACPILPIINTFELCEHVLSYLSAKDLGLTKSVCRQIKAVVDSSLLLQQDLFLKPRFNNPSWVFTDSTLLTGSKADQLIKVAEAKGGPTGEQVIFELHPALKIDRCNALPLGLIDTMDMLQDKHTRLDPNWTKGTFQAELVNDTLIGQTQTSSALDEMYLSQPPVKEVQVVVQESYKLDFHDKPFNYDWSEWYIPLVGITVRDEEGLTFGKVPTEVRRRFGGKEHAFVKHIHFRGGLPFTREDKEMIEEFDEITEKNDPYSLMPDLAFDE